MTSKKPAAPLRVLRLGRAFDLTRAVSQGFDLESQITLQKWP